ncbi:MAG TPA: DUF881 domain-containing protein [Candidatus Dormibacteraeota bacterium]|nr:DUF881 domain-containing protein [Candidatus Dormibacteraeota bacterium]
MRSRRGQLAVAAVTFALGLLLVIQLRAQSAGGGLDALSSQDLTTLIANLNLHNAQLRDEVSGLKDQLAQLTDAQTSGQSNVGELEAELQRLRLWEGADPVRGRGVMVTISGPISPDAANDILNELRLAGAEALAVQDQRVVPGVVIGGTTGALTLEGARLPDPFRIWAIGNPPNLQAILQRAGGLVSRIEVSEPSVSIEVGEVNVTLPGSTRPLVPADGKPRL